MSENSNIITPSQIQNALDADPAEILRAIHKRIVDTEKLMGEYRTFAMNQQTDIEMMQERIVELIAKVSKIEEAKTQTLDIENEHQINMFKHDNG